MSIPAYNGIGPRMTERPLLPPWSFRSLISSSMRRVDTVFGPSFVQSSRNCVGHFFDSITKRAIHINLGEVTVRFPISYRSAASPAGDPCDESFRGRGDAADRYDIETVEHRPELREDGAQAVENSPGPYVIPGQSATGGTNHQKLPDLGDGFEWSVEKCLWEVS